MSDFSIDDLFIEVSGQLTVKSLSDISAESVTPKDIIYITGTDAELLQNILNEQGISLDYSQEQDCYSISPNVNNIGLIKGLAKHEMANISYGGQLGESF